MRVLITGGTGFLGSHLARALVRAGHEVTLTVRPTSSPTRIADILGRVSLHELGSAGPVALFGGRPFDAVFHLAASYGRGEGGASAALETNALFPLRLLELALRACVGLFVAADTCVPPEYKHFQAYTLSKRQFAEWGRALTEGGPCRFVNLRLQHPYGRDDGPEKFVPMIVRRCGEDGDIELTAGEQRKDFIHVDDVCRAVLALLEYRAKLPPGFSQFECGSGRAVSIREFVEAVHRLSRSQATLRFGALPYRENEVMFSQADTRALSALGWSPEVSLERGILSLLDGEAGGATR